MFKYAQEVKSSLLPIKLDSIDYFIGETYLISNANIEIKSDGITVIMGPNGSGKSLFLNLLHGLILPNNGTITFNGLPLNKKIRRRQAMVFQTPTLLRRTVLSNMVFVDSLDGKIDLIRCKKILEMLGLEQFHNQPAKLLSSGEKQRLALARALVLKPDILLLDEPTANLDPASIYVIEEIVKNAGRCGVKIIFITHDISQAKRIGDDIIFIHKGKILEYKKTAALFKNPKCPETKAYIQGKIII